MNIVKQIKEKFKDKVDIFEKSRKRIYVTAKTTEDGKELVRYLFKDLGARMAIASGVDTRLGIEILYHMAMDRHNMIITVKVLVRKPELEMLSFTDFMAGSEWIEREIRDMFGVNFVGLSATGKFLLADDWPEGVYPLRKKVFEYE